MSLWEPQLQLALPAFRDRRAELQRHWTTWIDQMVQSMHQLLLQELLLGLELEAQPMWALPWKVLQMRTLPAPLLLPGQCLAWAH
jgi:hypothetical protein